MAESKEAVQPTLEEAVKAAPVGKSGTVKYRIGTTCYWNNTFYRVDTEVELPANLTPPKEYFIKL